MLLLAVFTLALTVSTDLVGWSAIVLILFGLVLLLAFVVWFIIRQPECMRGGIERLTRPWKNHPRLGRLKTHWSRMHESLQAVIKEKRPALGQALVLSLLGWVAMISEFWLLLRLVDVDFDLSTFFFLLAVTRLALSVAAAGRHWQSRSGNFLGLLVISPSACGSCRPDCLDALSRLRGVTGRGYDAAWAVSYRQISLNRTPKRTCFHTCGR